MKTLLMLLILALIAVAGKLSFAFFLSDRYLLSGLCTAICLFGISFVIISLKPADAEDVKIKE
jgi:hypothetical protein